MTQTHARPFGWLALACGGVAAAVYAVMVTITLTQLEALSGLSPFDLRPMGYDPAQAAALLDALGEEGRSYYLTRQIALDTFYPALLALALINAVRWLVAGPQPGLLARAAILCAVAVAVFDYAENIGIVLMIMTWPEVSDALVYAASGATILKSFLTILAVALVLAVGASRLRHRWARS